MDRTLGVKAHRMRITKFLFNGSLPSNTANTREDENKTGNIIQVVFKKEVCVCLCVSECVSE